MKESELHPGKRERWLAQFEPVPESELTERQRNFLASMRRNYPTAAAGRKDDRLHVYAYDEAIGPFSGLLPDG